MGYIVFQSDYGLGNGTAALYGVCKSVDLSLNVYDLTHEVPALNVAAAADNLATVVPLWPAGTVFVSAVDPATGTDHLVCAARLANGSYVFTADNGALSKVARSIGVTEVRDLHLLLSEYRSTQRSDLLHGRDLAWCAALLASGQLAFRDLGPTYPVDQIVL